MRKIFILIFFIAAPFVVNAQPNGDGSYGNPWSGTLSGNTTWSGTKYINGDITVDNEKLTISAGAIIIFLAEGADLIITGTGQLEAVGTSGSKITITADDDNDGIYGETGERWGHISFQSMGAAGTSNIEYCIIEYGRIIGTYNGGDIRPVYYGMGGAIYADFSDIVINNCTFRSNYAEFGGAIYIYGTSPSISNCNFVSNEALEAGGALLVYTGSGSLIENCLFQSNHCDGVTYSFYSGGAIYFGPGDGTASVVNCTFVQNTSDRIGDAIYFNDYFNYQVKNCILWGSNDQLNIGGTFIINCAIEGSVPNGSVNSIVLNSSNSASDGPNFTDPGGSDWSIKFVSPCRDIGTTPSPAIPDDYIGNPRIGSYDIGAYEVQYSRWKTAPADNTSWTNTGNWEQGLYPGLSGTTGDVVIPLLSGSSVAPNISGTTSIASTKYLILEPGAKATFGTLSNSGTLKLESDASNIASLILTSYTDSGAEAIELYLTGGYIGDPGAEIGRWHYISSPVTSLAASTFTVNTLDLAQWVDGIQGMGSIREGFVAYDGYIYLVSDPGDPLTWTGPTFSSLVSGKGYNFWDNLASYTYSFAGTLNTANVGMALDFAGAAYENGFNLLGNPFSSGLDWDEIIDGTYFTYPASTSMSLYFTRNNDQCSYVSGVGDPSDVTGIIPPMQGFFVKTYSTGNTITLAAGARTHNSIHSRYKGKSSIPLVRFSIAEDSLSHAETVIRFDEKADAGLDNEFDAIKMYPSTTRTAMYSVSGGTKYAINGQPFPESFVEIPIVLNLKTGGNDTISTIQLQGLDNYNVTLTDNTTGFIADLKTTPDLIFSSSAGTISDRFVLKITNISTGTEDPVVSKNIFNIYNGNGLINIQTIADEWDGKPGSVRVLDLTGKTVTDLQNAEFRKNSITQVRAPGARGLYVVEIRSGVMHYVGKVVIR